MFKEVCSKKQYVYIASLISKFNICDEILKSIGFYTETNELVPRKFISWDKAHDFITWVCKREGVRVHAKGRSKFGWMYKGVR